MEEDRHLAYLSDLHRRVREWRPWACTLAEVADGLGVDPSRGLDQLEARNRLLHIGPNVPVDLRQRLGLVRVFIDESTEPMMLLLLAVGALYSLWGEPWDAATIIATILAVVGLEVFTEWRAKRELASLRNSVPANTSVLRGGMEGVVAADDLVPGDVLMLCRGQLVPADAVVVVCHGFALDESALTGEADAVYKTPLASVGDDAGGDANSDGSTGHPRTLVYAGTKVSSGHAVCIVVATGALTEIGSSIATLVRDARPPPTPRQQQMRRLASRLSVAAIVLCVSITVFALVQGMHWRGALLMGMSLAFATIPEELPLIAKASLALGCRRLARRGLLVRRPQAADALGAVTVVVTDKTGTLTRNQLIVSSILTVAADSDGLAVEIVTPEAAAATERAAVLATPLYCAWALSVDPLEARPLARLVTSVQRGTSGAPGRSLSHAAAADGAAQGGSNFQPARGFGKDFMNTAVLQSLAGDGEQQPQQRDPDTGTVPLVRIADAIATVCQRLPEPTGELSFDPTLRISALTRSPAAPPPHHYSAHSPNHEDEPATTSTPSSPPPSPPRKHWTVLKGATEVLLPQCSRVWPSDGTVRTLTGDEIASGDVAGVVDMTVPFSQTLSRNATNLAVGGSRVIAYAIAITDEPLFALQARPGPQPQPRSSTMDGHPFRFRGTGGAQASGAPETIPTVEVAEGRHEQRLPGDLIFVGAFAFFDPPQRAARPALQECREAGIRVILATGDHPCTALAVANAVGITEPLQPLQPAGAAATPTTGSAAVAAASEAHAITGEMMRRSMADNTFEQLLDESNVFARMAPAQKLRLVHALQARGEVVAFIGDGINDAPALTRADVGICMGGNPSTADVAMDAANLIVLSGDFSGVVRCFREGLRLDANMHKCLRYYMACKVALVLAVLLLLVFERAGPLTPVQVIFIELFTDLGATWSFLNERPEGIGEPSLSAQKLAGHVAGLGRHVADGSGLLGCGRRTDRAVLLFALSLFATCTLPLIVPTLLLPHWAAAAVAPTVVFLTWMPAHALLGATMRTGLVPLRTHFGRTRAAQAHTNVPGLVWLSCSVLAVVVGAAIPPVSAHLGIVPLDAVEWILVAVTPLLLFVALELAKEHKYRRICRVLSPGSLV
ncbi:hypothetical protein LPJ61_001367 [Coemansia biformis]|uniref:Cation-transporting P-type ATPase N-terminal domain-containing protein n=1 Tax=Coemansia biformis TaxID=1286918 RepID=A0A9W7YA59_9FUNG|nr:hypothetical protein LPJ61_001367 [Coemansia biformis]